jgi:TP901 family phage tail tape measure protein
MAFSVAWTYQIIDRYSGPIRKVQKATDRARQSISKAQNATAKFGSSMASMQTGVASLAGVLGGSMMLNTFNNFETAMNKLGAVSLANDETMQRFRNTAKELGATTQFTATQVTEGMVFLKMAGLDANKVLEAIPGSLQLAAAGGIDLAASADIATNVLAQMGLEVSQLTRVNDALAIVQSAANTDIIQAAEALKNLGTTSSSLGISLESTTAFIGAMANAGVKGGEAGTLLRNAMLKLANATPTAQKTLRKLRIDLKNFVTPEGKLKNFGALIDQLSEKGATTADIFNIFQERGGRAILALQKVGTPVINELTKALGATGVAANMANIQMRGMPGVIKLLASAWESVQIAIFESGFADDLIVLFTRFGNFMRKVATSNPQLLKFAAIAGAIALALAPVLLMVGFMASGISALIGAFGALAGVFSFLLGPIALVAGFLALIVGATIKAFTSNEKLQKSLSRLWDALSPVIDLFKSLWKWVGGTDVIVGTLVETFNTLADVIGTILAFGIDKLASVIGFFTGTAKPVQVEAEGLFGNGANINAPGTQGNINGSIEVAAAPGSQVRRAEMTTNVPGNLGMNMAGAR